MGRYLQFCSSCCMPGSIFPFGVLRTRFPAGVAINVAGTLVVTPVIAGTGAAIAVIVIAGTGATIAAIIIAGIGATIATPIIAGAAAAIAAIIIFALVILIVIQIRLNELLDIGEARL